MKTRLLNALAWLIQGIAALIALMLALAFGLLVGTILWEVAQSPTIWPILSFLGDIFGLVLFMFVGVCALAWSEVHLEAEGKKPLIGS